MIQKTEFGFPGPIVAGVGAIDCLGERVCQMGGKRPLVVTGTHLEKAGVLDSILSILKKEGLVPTLFQEGHLDPTDKDAELGVVQYRDAQCDFIIALGGGSRIDVAKAIRLLSTHSGGLQEYYLDAGGAQRIKPNMPPLISIPTTAGSGSEVSRGAIITDTSQNRKRLIAGFGMMSSLSILDP